MSAAPLPRLDANLVWLDTIDSTNALAGRLLSYWQETSELPLPATLITATSQSAGRGRGGRRWLSPPGGVYATWLGTVPTAALGLMPMAAGVALAESVEGLVAGRRVGIKWPNDLVVEGGKLGGLLCEARTAGEASAVVVGFGINVAAVTAKELAGSTASLSELGYSGTVADAFARIAATLVARIRALPESADAIRRRWVARSVHAVGERLRLRTPTGELEGTFRGFDRNGSLLLEVAGEERRFAAGELVAAVAGEGG